MRLSGDAYSKRLREYSDDTIRLISQVLGLDKESLLAGMAITTNSELSEEQVVEKLKELIANAKLNTI